VEELSWDITDQVLVEYQSDLQFKQPTITSSYVLALALLDTAIWQSLRDSAILLGFVFLQIERLITT